MSLSRLWPGISFIISSLCSLASKRVSSRRFDLKPDLPQYRTTTVSGDERLASSSLHPGLFSDGGMEDLTARWKYATWLQGAPEI